LQHGGLNVLLVGIESLLLLVESLVCIDLLFCRYIQHTIGGDGIIVAIKVERVVGVYMR